MRREFSWAPARCFAPPPLRRLCLRWLAETTCGSTVFCSCFSPCCEICVAYRLLRERLDADFLEKDHIVLAVILEAEETFVGARAELRLEIEFACRDRFTLAIVRHFHAVHFDDGGGPVDG